MEHRLGALVETGEETGDKSTEQGDTDSADNGKSLISGLALEGSAEGVIHIESGCSDIGMGGIFNKVFGNSGWENGGVVPEIVKGLFARASSRIVDTYPWW